MGILIFAALQLACGQDIREVPLYPRDPFRKVGSIYYDLRPLFEWWKLPLEKRANAVRPCKDWRAILNAKSIKKMDGYFIVRAHGLYGSLALTNSPGFISEFIAKPMNASVQWLNERGQLEQAQIYDYGIPYDPNRRQTKPDIK